MYVNIFVSWGLLRQTNDKTTGVAFFVLFAMAHISSNIEPTITACC